MYFEARCNLNIEIAARMKDAWSLDGKFLLLQKFVANDQIFAQKWAILRLFGPEEQISGKSGQVNTLSNWQFSIWKLF